MVIEVRNPFRFATPNFGYDESGAVGVDDVRHETTWWTSCSHHGLSHHHVELIELIMASGGNCKLEQHGHRADDS